ncbi:MULTISPECIES: DHA2 family efflux MFS transporter permease subunit [Sphingomonas]|jgi:MFS transporter, DHA2 family, multidrug resistance protein|uniref:DHA2 family efflux MFS transporter permease subunit n=1 Tax=Sphingomonas echinoides TaxID=59803 RepID=A0ABU4PIB9_9SPHN|nr:DHA2 family efflux MFS transporter permease subunit [Sphingomonas echinoides]MDX5983791.1 DHA2 family efflux MFS transporter permease subunit [Sphingomonas echinoides]
MCAVATANPDAGEADRLARVPSTEEAVPLEERAALHTSNRPLLTIGVMAATIMQILDSTIANVALPHMQASLSATSDTVTWVLTSYIVASAVAIPLTGWLADRIGSRNLFLGAVVGFVIASMLCGLASSLPEMVIFRVLQGVAAAFMNPLSQTVMMDINPRSKQAAAMSIWGMGIMVGPILGPVIGGWLTDNYDWRWCFYVNVPIGIACFLILWALLPSREIKKRGFDIFGFSMLAVAISAFQLMLDRGQTQDWFSSWEVWTEGMVALGAAWMFFVQLFTAKGPMFDRALFLNRNLLTGVGFMLVIGVLMTATLALLPPMLQSLYGYPVLTAGILLMPRGIGIVASMYVAGQLMKRQVDPRLMVGTGLLIAGWSLYDMTSWTLEMGQQPFIVTGLVQGIGLGLVFIPLNIIAFGTLDPRYRTEASSLMNLARNIGGSAGISVVTALLARNIQTAHSEIGQHIPDPGLVAKDPVVSSITGGATDTVLAMADGIVNKQAAMVAYLDDFKLMMILTLASIPLVLLLQRPAPPKAGDEPVHVAVE